MAKIQTVKMNMFNRIQGQTARTAHGGIETDGAKNSAAGGDQFSIFKQFGAGMENQSGLAGFDCLQLDFFRH